MAKSFRLAFGGVNLTSGDPGDMSEMPEAEPFRLLVAGNLVGDRPRAKPLAQRKPVEIDRDNFDEILAKMSPGLTLPNPAGGADIDIAFRELDDFDPDRLYERLPIFDELRRLRSQLQKPATFAAAAAAIQAWAKLPPVPAPETTPKDEPSAVDIVREVIEESGERAGSELPNTGDWRRFLSSIVQPQLVERPEPRLADYENAVDEAIGAQMREILHHPRFQALEAAWRSVFLLIKRLPTQETLKVFVLDAGWEDWRADLADGDPSESVFVREIVEKAAERPWAAFVSLDAFGRQLADLETLASMVVVASQSRTPVLAGVSPTLVGCRSLADDPDPRRWQPDPTLATAWQLIRALPNARYLGAALPRFLLRLPFGRDAARTERFAFEETPRHDDYLWGSPAVACALLLAEGFASSGWNLDPDDVREIHGLPVHVYDDDGERTAKPCAEVHLRETALEALTDQGLMVLASVRDRDSVRLVRFQSAAVGAEPLAGRWSR